MTKGPPHGRDDAPETHVTDPPLWFPLAFFAAFVAVLLVLYVVITAFDSSPPDGNKPPSSEVRIPQTSTSKRRVRHLLADGDGHDWLKLSELSESVTLIFSCSSAEADDIVFGL